VCARACVSYLSPPPPLQPFNRMTDFHETLVTEVTPLDDTQPAT
jgi:hypothetical protein